MDDYITGLLLVIFIALAFITILAKESRLKKLHLIRVFYSRITGT